MSEEEKVLDGSQENGQQTAQPVANAGGAQKPAEDVVPKARLDGALRKIEELTLQNRALTQQVAEANVKVGEINASLTAKDTEWKAQVGENQSKYEQLQSERNQFEAELAKMKAEQNKVKMIAELGTTELFAIADQIPTHEDPEQQKAAIERLAKFATTLKEERERDLTAGTTGPVATQPTDPSLPSTAKEWERYIDKLPWGTPEREKAWDQYYASISKAAPKKA